MQMKIKKYFNEIIILIIIAIIIYPLSLTTYSSLAFG